ncbi:hypothetical protein [Actinophytocola sp.]|uniref:hypothetical protein n=1 Tax=Actinophytocola sp. TaxID=1872138 RepID=UPI003D6BA15F
MPLSTSGETAVALAPDRPTPPARFRGGFGRELAGALAVGLSVLAIVVLVFQVLAWVRDVPGPGATMVGGHLGAAVLAVLVQRIADKNGGWVTTVAAATVVVITVVTMWLLWWS